MSLPIDNHADQVPPSCDVCPFRAEITVTQRSRKDVKALVNSIRRVLAGTIPHIVIDDGKFHQRSTIVTCAPGTGDIGLCMREQVNNTLAHYPRSCTAEILNAGCRRTD